MADSPTVWAVGSMEIVTKREMEMEREVVKGWRRSPNRQAEHKDNTCFFPIHCRIQTLSHSHHHCKSSTIQKASYNKHSKRCSVVLNDAECGITSHYNKRNAKYQLSL